MVIASFLPEVEHVVFQRSFEMQNARLCGAAAVDRFALSFACALEHSVNIR
jgi:hypothetical protein